MDYTVPRLSPQPVFTRPRSVSERTNNSGGIARGPYECLNIICSNEAGPWDVIETVQFVLPSHTAWTV